MKTGILEALHSARAAWSVFIVLLFVLAAGRVASAQAMWTENSAYQTWVGYNDAFYAEGANGGYIIANQQGGSTFCLNCFWEEVESIQLAEDAYCWAADNYRDHDRAEGYYGDRDRDYSKCNYPTRDRSEYNYRDHDLSKYVNEIDNLCTGFIDNQYAVNVGPDGQYDLSGDDFNDDLDWAVMTFIRAYQITGKAEWLTVAEMNFNTVWNRAQDPGGLGNGLSGLIQSQPHGKNYTPNLDSPVNFTFVIDGYLIYESTGDITYKTEADNVYSWAMANLYETTVNDGAGPGVCVGNTSLTCAKIYDSTTGHSDYTYNYGIAIEAATLEGDYTKAQYIANWLMYNSNNPNYPYAGTYTLNGVQYNVLPDYGQGGDNDDGYNGIALRGVGFGYSRGALNSTTLAWAQANLQAAWELRNSANVMWNNWDNQANPLPVTPSTGLYSWDCSPAVAGMLDIPAPQ